MDWRVWWDPLAGAFPELPPDGKWLAWILATLAAPFIMYAGLQLANEWVRPRVGDCVDPGPFLGLRTQPCERPHFEEVFHVSRLRAEQTRPLAFDSAAVAACDAAFEGYVGVPRTDSRLFVGLHESRWLLGSYLACTVAEHPVDPLYLQRGPLRTGTLRGLGE